MLGGLGMRVMNPPSSPGCHAPGGCGTSQARTTCEAGKWTPGPGRPGIVTMRRAASSSNRSHMRGTALGRHARSGRTGHAASRSQEYGMRGEQDGGKISQAYQDHRPYLVDLAFRMLGDIGAAEDIVQDAFTRLMATKLGEIEDQRGWLIVVTSRLCLDQIKSARSRRERAHDASEIEFVTAAPVTAGRSSRPGHLRRRSQARTARRAATAQPGRAGRLRAARHLPDAVRHNRRHSGPQCSSLPPARQPGQARR